MSYKNIHHEYCARFIALLVALSVCTFYLKIYCIFPKKFFCMQTELKLSSPEIVSGLKIKRTIKSYTSI